MSEISAINHSNLVTDKEVNFKNPVPVIQIYPRAYGQKDEFIPANQPLTENKRRFNWFGAALTTASAWLLYVAGKKGKLGKTIQTWFGGRLSTKKLYNKIETKMGEYLSRDGKAFTTSGITTLPDGKKVFVVKFDNGEVRTYHLKETENLLKIFGEKTKREEEYIIFDKTTGALKSRINLKRKSSGRVKAYASYKGEDVLDKDFNEVTGYNKDYYRIGPYRKVKKIDSTTGQTTVNREFSLSKWIRNLRS